MSKQRFDGKDCLCKLRLNMFVRHLIKRLDMSIMKTARLRHLIMVAELSVCGLPKQT